MAKLSELKPTKRECVYKLLEQVGIKGPKNRNQNFLSRPAFHQGKKVVVNFWYGKQIRRQGEDIIVKWRLPATTEEASPRMKMIHNAIRSAIERNLKIRVIVLDGKMARKGSKVFKRSLDPFPWAVTDHNAKSGECVLTRDDAKREPRSAVNDLTDIPEGNLYPDRAKAIAGRIERDDSVRKFILSRAKGRCEHCGTQGFATANGRFYVEAHHVIALCDSGHDTVDNVIALCPQHHRQAHYGRDAESLEKKFIAKLKKINRRAAFTPLQRPN